MSGMLVVMVIVMVVAFFGSGARGMHGQVDAPDGAAAEASVECPACTVQEPIATLAVKEDVISNPPDSNRGE